MGKIVLLDDATINKIAAGEVVERPASAVKELMENSIDAGATNIVVDIKNGGISYIRVTDNGKGIQSDDLEMAFERHATSKLRSAKDLNEIKSMGFRGEALASIAAISKITMQTKTEKSSTGYKIVVEGGKVDEIEEVGCPNGTSITVENLFYNTPVRYKFLKKDFTESGYIEDMVARIALVHPEIAIKLISSGKVLIQTSGNGNIHDVIYGIYGKDIAENLIDINYEYENVKVTGVIGKPVISRSNRANQIFFVNERYVKDKTLSGAAEQGFKGLITIGKHGFLILNLEMNPSEVDVNVHPTKLEVRFQDENKIFKAVYHAIKEGLLKADLVTDSDSIEGIDKGKKNQDNSQDKEKLDSMNATTFRDIVKKEAEKDEEPAKKGKASKVKEEETTYSDEDFNNVIAKLQAIKEQLQKETQVDYTSSETKDEEIKEEETEVVDKEKEEVVEEQEEKEEKIGSKEAETEEDNSYLELDDKIKSKIEKELSKKEEKEESEEAEEKEEKTEEVEDLDTTKAMNAVGGKHEKKEESKDKVLPDMEIKTPKALLDEINRLRKENKNESTLNTEDEDFLKMYEKNFGISAPKIEEESEEDKKINGASEFNPAEGENVSLFDEEEKEKPAYKIVGVAFRTYIIVEMKNDLYLIDQHAAHERILYEKVKKNYFSDSEKDSQLMLLPDVVHLTHKEMAIYQDNRDIFKKAGFVIDEFGDSDVKISGVPNIWFDLNTKELFLETLDEINTIARTAKQEVEERFIATVACKAAVKAHMDLSNAEIEELLNGLLVLPNTFTCPHGRPTAIKITNYDLEKKFSRKQ